ncbi:MAG: hypothetical protein J6569_01920 [Gilliamella sp.]|uniref:hypothetical protein n=1 Tax=unclassified Gilliamella TaxID=2685620 RepID=UPI00117B1160|nr:MULTISPECIES: hypothetical protein [Gilliamella]MCO6538123.1 hypothetical protein [Gilliamella sp.]MCO6538873.1 hypothetical protein [Gilliamella sp.]
MKKINTPACGMKRTTIDLLMALREQLDQYCFYHKISMADYIRQLIKTSLTTGRQKMSLQSDLLKYKFNTEAYNVVFFEFVAISLIVWPISSSFLIAVLVFIGIQFAREAYHCVVADYCLVCG